MSLQNIISNKNKQKTEFNIIKQTATKNTNKK